MNCEREMTLDEWVGRLLPTHRAARELAELRVAEARESALRSRVEGLVAELEAKWTGHCCCDDAGTEAAGKLRELLSAGGKDG